MHAYFNVLSVNTTNKTKPHSDPEVCMTDGKSTSQLVFFAFVGLLIAAENIIGFLVIKKSPQLQTTTFTFVASLAFTDIIVGVSWFMIALSELALSPLSWWLHTITQTITIVSATMMSLVSIMHLAVIALERYLYIAKPYVYLHHVTKTSVKWVIVVLWGVGIIGSASVSLEAIVHDVRICSARHLPKYMILTFIIPFYLLSALIACLAYIEISRIALKQRRSILAVTPRLKTKSSKHEIFTTTTTTTDITTTTSNDNATNSTTSNVMTIAGESRPNVVTESFSEVMKSVRLFVIVMGLFVVFTSPGAMAMAVYNFATVPKDLYTALLFGNVLNSSMNFMVLTLIDSTFRRALKDMFRKICRR